MAYISVDKWRTDQVVDWLKGLDDSMYSYVNSFSAVGVLGSQLLNIRPYELEKLGMHLIGHQEIVLDAVENLRNIHHNLDTENLQFLALHVATSAGSLHRQLSTIFSVSQIETKILNDITNTIATIKPLIAWLNRAPFRVHGHGQFTELCMKMLRLGLEMATIAQRDRFVENPVDQLRKTAKILEGLANYIIQDITDPLILQPASLSLVTLKKRESDLGFNIESSFHGVHRVTDIKNSPAHTSGKIEDGDEIVQINYQTVVGWQYKSVLKNLSESPPDVLLTVKKPPRHTKIYGQIYMQPYRLPSKKRVVSARWGGESSIPSPKPNLLTVPDEKPSFNIPVVEKNNNVDASSSSDSDSSCSDLMTPTDVKETEKEKRLFYPKPRTMLQRRNTICGDELFGRMTHVSGLPPAWLDREKVGGANCDPASPSLRDKSKSFGFGLEITPRPTTCIGIAAAASGNTNNNNNSDTDAAAAKSALAKRNESIKSGKENIESSEKFKPGVSKVVRFDANMKYEDYHVDEKYTCNVENTILETFAPIPFVDDDEEEECEIIALRSSGEVTELDLLTSNNSDKRVSVPLAEAVNIPVVVNLRRGRLDKSHSTPAYDNSGEESDTPPAIEPRKIMLTPPVPPPRPRKQRELTPPVVPPPPPKPAVMQQLQQQQQQHLNTPNFLGVAPSCCLPQVPKQMHIMQQTPTPTPTPTPTATQENSSPSVAACETVELNTPTRTRTLTLRKKHNLIKRRRNVNLKLLGSSSDISISSHLYRRTKDHRGVTYWARLYFVMLDTILYGFRTKDAPKASSLIFLPGFTVSLAKEVHSKPHAFKVYHAAKTFYFAAESLDALNQWVEFIRAATLQSNTGHPHSQPIADDHDANPKDLFSETDSSGEENESLIAKNLSTPSPQSSKDISTSNLIAAASTPTSTTTAAKNDRRYLGSLRKLTKGTFKSSSNSEKKISSDIPVPTEQYRCYRKVPGGSFGIQIGTNTPGYTDSTLQPILNTNAAGHTAFFRENDISLSAELQPQIEIASTSAAAAAATTMAPASPSEPPVLQQQHQQQQQQHQQSALSISSLLNSSTDSAILGPPSSPAPTPSEAMVNMKAISASPSRNDSFESPSKGSKKMPYNFIHASNPNLLEIDFQTSKALDYSLPKINPADSWDANKNPHGFKTLKDLMLQKQKEEAQEMYNNRVLLGVERKVKEERHRTIDNAQHHHHHHHHHHHQQQQSGTTNAPNVKTAGRNKLTGRSLPKTPDYEISFKPDDESIKRTRTKEGQKLRDFGYELISGDEPIGSIVGNAGTGGAGAGAGVESVTSASRQDSNTSTASSIDQTQSHHHHHHDHSWTVALRTRNLLKSQHFLPSVGHKSKKHSSNSCSSVSSADIQSGCMMTDKRSGSFKKKGKLEVIKSSSERLFTFNKHSTTLLPSTQGMMTMTLPLNKKLNHHVLDENSGAYITERSGGGGGGGGSGIKKSHTYNNDLKDKASGGKYDAQRKNSAPIFSKLTTSGSSNKISKEKRLLGSPLLHRTLFGSGGSNHQHHPQQQQQQQQHHQQQQKQHQHQSTTSIFQPTTANVQAAYDGREYDHEIFSQVTFSKVPSYQRDFNETARRRLSSTSHNANAPDAEVPNVKTPATTPEYPHMECPPVFEPEIYSVSEPNASLSLLLRKNNSSSGGGGGAIASSIEEPK